MPRFAHVTLAAMLLVAAVWSDRLAAGDIVPLRDAAAYWSMNDAGTSPVVRAHGNVVLGVQLTGEELAASLARGGDGRVAQFDGGYLELAHDAELAIEPRQWTIAIRLRDPLGKWQYPILGSYGDDKSVSIALRAVDLASKPMEDRNYLGHPLPTIEAWLVNPSGPRAVTGSSLIEAVWGAKEVDGPRARTIRNLQPKDTWPNPLEQDVMNAVMRVNFPVGLIGPTEWHDVVVALTGSKLVLWIDGVLVDEEYPLGETRPRTLPFLIGAGQEQGELKCGFRGLIDHVAVWNRALSPAEVAVVSGGAPHVRQRELAILGDESPSMQYFRARGHNRKAGDCIPYWDAQTQTFRLYYLILRRNMHSKWDGGHGGLEIWQASTQDLKTWTHHPVTIPITEQWEAWNGTGAVAYYGGQYNWFYPTPHYEGQHNGVQRAVSRDGIVFEKTSPHPFLPGGDVEVFVDDSGVFNMVKNGPVEQARTRPLRDKTLVAWVRLADLEQHGGSILTVEHPDVQQFDGIVFGEIAARRWMPGSDTHKRTPHDQQGWQQEHAQPAAVVQVTLTQEGSKGVLYRNGAVYAQYTIAAPMEFPTGSSLLIGLRHTNAGLANRLFRGRVLDARVYDRALTAEEITGLKPDVAAGPPPVAWYDFANGSLKDRAGNFPDARLLAGAHIDDGELVLDNGGYLKVPGTLFTQVRATSTDLATWTDQPGAFISSDRHLATCPNVFEFRGWHYYICGSGVWKSKGWCGPWIENVPLQLDNLAVPKTAAFGADRRIYAGFLPDDGWGGNEVLRELVQDADGNLATRFVEELIPATGSPTISLDAIRVAATDQRSAVDLPNVLGNYRLQMDVVPETGIALFGLALCADSRSADSACELLFHPKEQSVAFSKMSGSAGKSFGGPSLVAVDGLDKPFAVDIVVRHDMLDVQIDGRRALVTRFWNPAADRLTFFALGGQVTFRNLRISPLEAPYKPYPQWTRPGSH
jgi:hypothetical protein